MDALATTPTSAVDTIRKRLRTDLLTRGRVVVIGLGGIGMILARYLVLFLSAFKDDEFRVVLCDGDSFSPENTYRMDVPEFDNKAIAVASQLSQLFGRAGLHLRWVPQYVTAQNIEQVVQPGDCVFLCVDNHATRKLVSERCATLPDVTLISGGNDGIEGEQQGTYGNVQVFLRSDGKSLNPTLDQFHPEIATPADRNPADLDCMQMAAAGAPQILFANLAVASMMCNALLRLLMPPAERMYDEVCLDIVEAMAMPHRLMPGV